MQTITIEKIKQSIRSVPDFPKKGINFKDITTVIKQPEQFNYIINEFYKKYKDSGITKVCAIEARGFIIGAALAAKLNAGFVPVRKPGKLPADTYEVSYELEYGKDELEIHKDALSSNDVVLLHDDLLATGGTSKATLDLLVKFGISKIFICYLVELDFLKGRDLIPESYEICSLIHF